MDMLANLGFEPLDDGSMIFRPVSGAENASVIVSPSQSGYVATLAAQGEQGRELQFSSDDIRDIAAFALAVENEVIYRDTGNYPEDETRTFEFEGTHVLNPFADMTYGDFQCRRGEFDHLEVIHPQECEVGPAYIEWRDARFGQTPKPAAP